MGMFMHNFEIGCVNIRNTSGKKFMEISLMRHGNRINRLGRPADQRKCLIRSLVTEVLTHGKITTTPVRAKVARKSVDKIITLSKRGGIHSRRQMEAIIYNKSLVKSILTEAPSRYENRQGGYCRVIQQDRRRKGDATPTATLELI